MTEAARRNPFWNYDSPNCCNNGVLNNIHRTEGKGWRKTALFSTSPQELIAGEERGHPQHVKSVSRICQAADCSDSSAEASDRTSSKAGPGKRATRQVHNRKRTASQVRGATEMPYSSSSLISRLEHPLPCRRSRIGALISGMFAIRVNKMTGTRQNLDLWSTTCLSMVASYRA